MSELIRGRYEELEVIGSGGQGRVVRALDHVHGRTVALKVRSTASAADREALLSEARILFGLPISPHLPVVREDFFSGDDYVIVMDWVEGTDLARILHEKGRPGLPPTLVLEWLADAAAALTHLHTQDPPVIHGDVKPANLILTRGGRVALVDFGTSSTPIGVGGRGGTPGFAAPERAARGESTRATDVYSLAATAFALLTGEAPAGIRPPWEGVDPRLAAHLEATIREGLATDPARRPTTPGELVERLRAGWGSSLPTGVVTLCLTDVVGSSELWEAQPTVMSYARAVYDDVVATAVERRGGRLVDARGEGDATMSVFVSPGDAVAAAADVLRDLAGSTWPGGIEMRARVALHTGEVEVRGGAFLGATIHTAAHLRDLADAGQVLLSADTARLVRDHLPERVALVALGPARIGGGERRTSVWALSAPGVAAPPPGDECPYPGLLAFGTADADRYFGREDVAADLIERLGTDRFVAVIGASGSGKSSLARAGVAARWPGGADVVTPGTVPEAVPDGDAGPSDRLLVVDQLEELFTVVEPGRRGAVVDRLLAARRPVLVALRADFYGRCASYPRLASALARSQVLLGPMTPAELRAAIEEPARRAGLRLESGLVELLVSEVEGEPGELPLLAHALRATWEARDGRTLDVDAYRATGGVEGAIGATADQVMASLDEDDRLLARELLLRLVEPGDGTADTRRRATLDELRPAGDDEAGSGGGVDRVVDALAAARLVSVDEGSVEVAHEALIREWPQLRGWLADERSDLRVQRQITDAASAWDAGGREPTELYRGPRLAAALDWLGRHAHASALEAGFVSESAAEQERAHRAQARANSRLRALLAAVAIALVLALVGAALTVVQGRRAEDARGRAEVARIAATSRSLTQRQPDVGMLLAVEALQREDSAETRSAMLSALEAHPLLEGLLHGSDVGFGAALFVPGRDLVATPTSDGQGTLLWDTHSRRKVGALRKGNRIVIDAAASPDGSTLVATTVAEAADGLPVSRLEVWDVARRRLRHDLESPAGLLSAVAFGADGETVIAQGGAYVDRPPALAAAVWDTSTWEPQEPWPLSDDYLDDSVAFFSGDGRLLAIPDGDGVTLFGTETRQRRNHLTLDGQPTALALSSDGSTLAVGFDSGAVVDLDSTTGEQRSEATRGSDGTPTVMQFGAGDAVLAVGDQLGRTQLVDTESGAALGPPLAANTTAIVDVAFDAEGTRLVTTGGDRSAAIWRLDGRRTIGERWQDHEAVATSLAVTSDGRLLVSAGGDATVVARDLASGETTSAARREEVLAVDVTRSGAQVVSGDASGAVVVAALPSLEESASTSFPDVVVHDTRFNPRSGVVAVAVERPAATEEGGDAGFVAFWDPATGDEPVARISEAGGFPLALTWTPDGSTLAVAFDNNVVRVYRVGGSASQVGEDLASEDDAVTALAVSPDGVSLAAGTSAGIVRRFDMATLQQVGPDLRGHTFEIGGVTFSPDGSLLASTTVGLGTTRLWDVATGSPLGDELVSGRTPVTARTLPIDHPYPSRPAFAPDGRTLFTPAVDGAISAWDLRPASWLRAACRVVGRELTDAEWHQHVDGGDRRPTCGT